MAKIGQIKIDNKSAINSNVLSKHAPVTKIGIQAPSGTKFQLNQGSEIEMGAYGIYELDITGLGYIDSLVFKTTFAEDEYALIDIVYHGEGV